MPDWTALWENERRRWSYMTDAQLERRLKKIKKPEKLACFFEMCRRRRNFHLYDEAEDRADELGVRIPPVPTYALGQDALRPDELARRREELNNSTYVTQDEARRFEAEETFEMPKQTKLKKKKPIIRVIRFKGKEK